MRIDVEILRQADRLDLRYLATGRIAELRIPTVTQAIRADGLWKHTCFEAFLGAAGSDAYFEFNFAPSTQWAAYRFQGYREGMQPKDLPETPSTGFQADEMHLELDVAFVAAGPPAQAIWRIGLSAVIEETSGRKSYWALAHPAGKPDFHSPEGFVCELSPTENS